MKHALIWFCGDSPNAVRAKFAAIFVLYVLACSIEGAML